MLLVPGASGNQVLGNQIGVIGPSTNGLYFAWKRCRGVSIESTGTAGDPCGDRLFLEQRHRRSGRGLGNIISANKGYGVQSVGVGATRNLVEANYIGAAPGGGYVLGTGDPGNLG